MYSNLKVIRTDNYNTEFRIDLGLLQSIITQLKLLFGKLILVNDIHNVSEHTKSMMNSTTFNVKITLQGMVEFLKVAENRQYLSTTYEGYTFQHRLNGYLHSLLQINTFKGQYRKGDAVLILDDLKELTNEFYLWLFTYTDHIGLQREHDKKLDQLNLKIAESQAELHLINSQRTELIYSNASIKYLEFARNYEWAFYVVFFGAVVITIVSFVHFPHSSTDLVDYVLYKVLTVSIVVTIGTIFLRKASHLRNLHDQANQTSLELQALPMFLKNIDASEHSEIYKNLADKYFGKELDQKQNNKIGDLLQEQVKAGTELIKASAEMVKSIKPEIEKTASEIKPKNNSNIN